MRFVLFTLVLLSTLSLKAQISITDADMPVVGDTMLAYQDTSLAGFSIGQSGANRTWNFSTLQPEKQVTTYAVAPASTPYAADFPNANLVLTNDFNAYLYYRNTTGALKAEGFASVDPNLGTVSVNFNPIPDQYQFPTEYLENFSGSSGFVEAKPFNQLPPNIQQQINSALSSFPGATVSQVRVTFTSNYKDTIDAWGAVTTPIGTYEALRRKRIENSNTKIEAQVALVFPPTPFWYEVANVPSTTTEHSWLAKNTKMPLVTLGYDSLRNVISASYSATPPLPNADFTWTNPSGGLVTFTDATTNNPLDWAWDFGDGGTSTQQNPSHIYAANGKYNVCLTVSNVSGQDVFCDSVDVTNITAGNNAPVAIRDSAQIVYPNTATIDLLANDIDPDGDNIVYNIFFPPLNGTVTHTGNGVIEYEANPGFRGIDSFFYKISDDGQPVKSDTGTVVIRVDGAPFANFSYASSGFSVVFQNLSSGEDSILWDFGDGVTASTNTATHIYLGGTYNVCLTAFNAFGQDDTCRTVQVPAVGIAGVEEAAFNVYPNPAAGFINVEAELNGESHTAELYNALGARVLQSKMGDGVARLDISSLPAGVCRLQVINSKGAPVFSTAVLIAR